MPAVSTPAAPSTPVVSTPSAITVSASEKPLLDENCTLHDLPGVTVPAEAAHSAGRAEHGHRADRIGITAGELDEDRAVGDRSVPVDERAVRRKLHAVRELHGRGKRPVPLRRE